MDVQKYYLPEWYDANWRIEYPNMTPLIGNEPQHEEIYWSEDEDETAEDTCSNRGEDMVGEYIKENGVTDELFENKDTRPYEEGKGKAYAPPKDTPPDPND